MIAVLGKISESKIARNAGVSCLEMDKVGTETKWEQRCHLSGSDEEFHHLVLEEVGEKT